MNKLIHRITRKRLIYKILTRYWNPLYTPIEGLYVARIYKKVRLYVYAPTPVRFARPQGSKPSDEELEDLMREYDKVKSKV